MGTLADLDRPWPTLASAPRRPAAVRFLDAYPLCDTALALRWQAARGGGFISGYRIERTREGRHYETLRETCNLSCVLSDVPPGEPWFYRVTAFNAAGPGRATRVFFYQRRGPGSPEMCMAVPVIPGVRVNLCVMEPIAQSDPPSARRASPAAAR